MLRKVRIAGKEPRVSSTERALRIASISKSGGGSSLFGRSLLPSFSSSSTTTTIQRSFHASVTTTWSAPAEDNGGTAPPLAFRAQAVLIPHPEKAFKGGEDAVFVSEDGLAMGVFDGVGAWADMGVDPGLYSKALAKCANEAYAELGPKSPKAILSHAHAKTMSITGSSTACCVTIFGSTLRAANIGDSGFLVIRDGSLLYRQKEQQHGFNFPYQLGTGSSDSPDDAECTELELAEGDVVVVASDGVLDNLFAEEIVAIVREGVLLKKSELEVASRIAQLSSAKANLSSGRTPFAVAANQAGYQFSGGKLDDISVVVGFVVQKPIKAAL